MYYEIRNAQNANLGQFLTKKGAIYHFNNHIHRKHLIENIANNTNKIGNITLEELEKGFKGFKLLTIG